MFICPRNWHLKLNLRFLLTNTVQSLLIFKSKMFNLICILLPNWNVFRAIITLHLTNLASHGYSQFRRYFLAQLWNVSPFRKIRMLQPNRIAGFEVNASALFCAFCNASSRHSVCTTNSHSQRKASNFNLWKEHLWLKLKFKTF